MRIVLLTKRWAIKVPNFLDGWKLFLKGLLSNMQERELGRMDYPELCPVLFSLPGGWLVVMRRVELLSDDEWPEFINHPTIRKEKPHHVRWCGVVVERKANSFGRLDGRVVCIDYGS